MNNTFCIKATKIEQPIGNFYVGIIDYRNLIRICSTDLHKISSGKYDIFQRKLDIHRIPSLKLYMQYSKATFPNGIILSLDHKLFFEQDKLYINPDNDKFFIIDGQHRVEALKHYNGKSKFQVCVVIFENANEDLNSEIFSTVNSEQRKVNPSVKINLKGNDIVDTPEKIVRTIAIALNDNHNSPFYNRISFTDKDYSESRLSLASFAKPIINYIYDSNKSYIIKDDLFLYNNNRSDLSTAKYGNKKILWRFYQNKEDEIIYLMLLNYFTVIKDLFPEDWNDNIKSLLPKTSGYSALMMLFEDVLKNNPNNMSYDNILNVLKPLSGKLVGHFSLEEIGLGQAASRRLYKKFKNIIYHNFSDKDFATKTIDVEDP